MKWSLICKQSFRKCFFGDIKLFGKFSIKFPIKAVKLTNTGSRKAREEKEAVLEIAWNKEQNGRL